MVCEKHLRSLPEKRSATLILSPSTKHLHSQPPNRLLHSQFFANPSTATRSLSQSYTYTHQSASSTSHPSIADTRLRALVAEVRQKFADRSPPKSSIGDGVTTLQIEDEEKRKKVEREQDKCRRELEERVKDLEVEVTCAKAREDEAKRLVEEFARVQAQAGWVGFRFLRCFS